MITAAKHHEMLTDTDTLLAALRKAQNKRPCAGTDAGWQTVMVDGKPVLGWVVAERTAILEAANKLARKRGLPEVTVEQAIAAEESACGHSDYTLKYALRMSKALHGIS